MSCYRKIDGNEFSMFLNFFDVISKLFQSFFDVFFYVLSFCFMSFLYFCFSMFCRSLFCNRPILYARCILIWTLAKQFTYFRPISKYKTVPGISLGTT